MPWYAASIIANAAIMGVEYINRTTPDGVLHALSRSALLIAVAQVCLYYAFNGAPHWLMAWAVFVLGNAGMRVCMVYLGAGHEVASWNFVLAGTTIMLVGTFIIKKGLT